MTKDQIRHKLQLLLPEYFEGYILVGCVVGRQEVVIVADSVDDATRKQLVCGALNVIHSQVFNDTNPEQP